MGKRLYIITGLYVTMAEGSTGKEEHTGLDVVTGGQDQVKEQGYAMFGHAASDAGLQEEMILAVIVSRLACGTMNTAGPRARRSTASMSCHGSGHRRGYTSLTSRAINQLQQGSPRKGGSIRLLSSLAMSGQVDRHQRPMKVCEASLARRLGKPRSTRRPKVVEFVGGTFRLGRGGAPLRA